MQPHDDQGVYNVCYRDEWERLPLSWNWKPYWGWASDAVIVHFHGPKPVHARSMLAGNAAQFGPEFEQIFNRSPSGYAKYLAEFDQIVSP
jgi:lipopolysaccharide biosynthesis glycosyltransferase